MARQEGVWETRSGVYSSKTIRVQKPTNHPKVIRELHRATEDSEDQQSRGTQLLEIYALEIQMYNETKNYKKLKVG